MTRFLHTDRYGRNGLRILLALIIAAMIRASFAAELEDVRDAENREAAKRRAQIECTTPDGRVSEVAIASEQNKSAPAMMMNDETLTCPLQEGETTFVIKLLGTFRLDHFTLVNENGRAAGHLKIFVSDRKLPASSNEWRAVDGNVTFNHKRLFNLSMIGVEARYVKLAFHVRQGEGIEAVDPNVGKSRETLSQRNLPLPRKIGTIAPDAETFAMD